MTRLRELRRRINKAARTISVLRNLFMAQTFGEYMHSTGGPDEPDMAIYVWRGKRWGIPTSHISEDTETR